MWSCSYTASRKYGTRGATRWSLWPTPDSGPSLPTTADMDSPTRLHNPRRPPSLTLTMTSLQFLMPLPFLRYHFDFCFSWLHLLIWRSWDLGFCWDWYMLKKPALVLFWGTSRNELENDELDSSLFLIVVCISISLGYLHPQSCRLQYSLFVDWFLLLIQATCESCLWTLLFVLLETDEDYITVIFI